MTKTADEARDVTQEAWMLVLDHPKLPPDEEAGAWLHAVVTNVARSRIRKAKRRLRILETSSEEFPGPVRLQGPGIEASLLFDAVNQTIGEMGSLQRRILLHRVVDGLSTRETAEAVDRSIGTVKSSLSRAVALLKDRFGDDLKEALGAISVRRSKKIAEQTTRRTSDRGPRSAQVRETPQQYREGNEEEDETSTKEDSNENGDE